MKVELELIKSTKPHHKDYNACLIATLTGYTVAEIQAKVNQLGKKKRDGFTRWHTRLFVDVIQSLGYSCSNRFKKFDPSTENPCLVRFIHKTKKENVWYPAVYNDGKLYFPDWIEITLEHYSKTHGNELKLNSMIEVWITA